jgi:hypothetical protein
MRGALALVEVGKTLLESAVHVFVDLDVLVQRSVLDRLQSFARIRGGGNFAAFVRAVVHEPLLSAADGIRMWPLPVR